MKKFECSKKAGRYKKLKENYQRNLKINNRNIGIGWKLNNNNNLFIQRFGFLDCNTNGKDFSEERLLREFPPTTRHLPPKSFFLGKQRNKEVKRKKKKKIGDQLGFSFPTAVLEGARVERARSVAVFFVRDLVIPRIF